MLQLRDRIATWDAEPFVVRLTLNPSRPLAVRDQEGLLFRGAPDRLPDHFSCYFMVGDRCGSVECCRTRMVTLPATLSYLGEGDIIRVHPREGRVAVLYRRESRFNVLLATERCNSYCIMCSQPPRRTDDHWLVDAWLQAIPLMDRATPLLCISGGEPTLLGADLMRILRACKNYLPQTPLLLLSNGRMFSYLSLCQALANVRHPDLTVAVPLYSDLADQHNFVVQATRAFDQAVRGIMNLKRCGVRIEIRIVIHRLVIDRLGSLARFIVRNLPFADHVALMGLELTGHARGNLDALWVDPFDYAPLLCESVRELARHRIPVSIYNHPLCLLSPEVWSAAKVSISDWKNEFVEACDCCCGRDSCGGFFASSRSRPSPHIRPLNRDEWERLRWHLRR